jgi:hypothetical protein
MDWLDAPSVSKPQELCMAMLPWLAGLADGLAPMRTLQRGGKRAQPCQLAAHASTHCIWLHDRQLVTLTQKLSAGGARI